MNARLFSRLAPQVLVTLACTALALCLPACDCAGNTGMTGNDAGDTGSTSDSGPPRDTGPDTNTDTGVHVDAGGEAGPQTDAGACSNPETCNGMDDDCDGNTDENIVVSCGSDTGICRSGTQTCAAGVLGACTGGMMAGPSDVCGNGLDDDCDESVDESCTCTNGATQGCGSGVGTCRRGMQTCAGSMWGACAGEVTPTAELCDGLDNNCDGTSDETFAGLGSACDGPDADMCREGVFACSVDHLSLTCGDATGDTAEACNGTDDNCDGRIDEGCACTDGATQPCGTAVGECVVGMQTCAAGAWGSCVGSTGPTAEICNMLDDNCDGTADEGFVTGTMCDGTDTDLCPEGMMMCDPTTGGVICSDMTTNTLEVCNGTDDNCDGATDEGFMITTPPTACDGPDTDMCNEGAYMCTAGGASACSDATGDSVETCNNMDDDCDGMVDEGNPGGTTTMIGTCVSQTFCMGGMMINRGTFVSAAGLNTNPGTSGSPLALIHPAIANAVAIGGGADVCVCDPPGGVTSTFTDNVTMVEGVSVLGGLDCGTWMPSATSVTAIQDTDADGLTFPAAITAVTALDHMTVLGFVDATAGATTSAITVTDSSPTLSTDTVRAAAVTNAIGLRIVHATAATSPTITNGTYSASGIAGGVATSVSIEGASPHFTTVAINGGGASGIAVGPTTSYGVNCTACAGTTFTGGNASPAAATTSATGFAGTGDLTGVTATTTSFGGGATSGNGSTSAGIALAGCTGAPTFTTVNSNGGANAAASAPTMTTRLGFTSTGAACAPVIDGGRYVGCENGSTCVGVDANTGSPLVVRNVIPAPGGGIGIQGTTGAVDASIGMRCRAGACASITGSTISVGTLSRTGPTGVGLWLLDSSPAVDNNRITGPNAQLSVAMPPLQLDGLLLQGTTSALVTNNVIHDGTHALRVFTVLFDITALGAVSRGPTVVNNTIDYTPCTTCGQRAGLVFFSNVVAQPAGTFRNNIVRNNGAGGNTTPVLEANANADPMVFENNALFDATAMGGTIYLDEGMTSLTTGAGINALNGIPAATVLYSGNQVVDCMVNATFHIPMASACRDTGTMMSCPNHDFDSPASPRPTGPACDIGADEFVP